MIAVTILIFGVVLGIWFVTIYKVSGTNTENGIKNKSYIVADKFFYKIAGLKPLDVVVYKSDASGRNLFGRIIAIPGDEIVYADDAILVNNKEINIKYVDPLLTVNYPKVDVTLGDNQYLIVQSVSNQFSVQTVSLDRITGRFLFVN